MSKYTTLMLTLSTSLLFAQENQNPFQTGLVSGLSAMAPIAVLLDGFSIKTKLQETRHSKAEALQLLRTHPWGQYFYRQNGTLKQLSVVPFVGFAIGVQNASEQWSSRYLNVNPFMNGLLASMFAGTMSAPLYILFNDSFSKGFTPMGSIRNMTVKKIGLISARETAFYGSLAASLPVAGYMKARFGDNAAVANMSHFGVGFAGSVAGQFSDNRLVQGANAKQEFARFGMRALMRGGLVKGVTVGLFNVGYQNMKPWVRQKTTY